MFWADSCWDRSDWFRFQITAGGRTPAQVGSGWRWHQLIGSAGTVATPSPALPSGGPCMPRALWRCNVLIATPEFLLLGLRLFLHPVQVCSDNLNISSVSIARIKKEKRFLSIFCVSFVCFSFSLGHGWMISVSLSWYSCRGYLWKVEEKSQNPVMLQSWTEAE